MSDLERRIAKLEAAEEIRHLKVRYAQACDRGYHPEDMVPLYTEDAYWTDVSGHFGTYDGLEAICGFFSGVSSSMTWAKHYMISPVIEVADDVRTATGHWYLWQSCTLDGQATWIVGTYNDQYRNEDGVWKFSRMEVSFDTITPIDKGWELERFKSS
jgi:hypothetical protein